MIRIDTTINGERYATSRSKRMAELTHHDAIVASDPHFFDWDTVHRARVFGAGCCPGVDCLPTEMS